MYDCVHRNIVVHRDFVDLAVKIAENIFGNSGNVMFSTPLRKNDSNEITHYISSGMICSDIAKLFPIDYQEINNVTGEVITYRDNNETHLLFECAGVDSNDVTIFLDNILVTDVMVENTMGINSFSLA